jgi:DNA-binding HxlR family transcriptional regulator
MTSKNADEELRNIRVELDEIRADVKKMLASSGRTYVGTTISNEKALNILLNQLTEDIETGLERGMVRKCGKRKTCKAFFTNLLQGSADMVGMDNVSEEQVRGFRSELEKRRSEAPDVLCTRCYKEVSYLLDRNIRIIRSMRPHHTDDEVRKEIDRIQEDLAMRDFLEPVSSKQRLKILKMLTGQSRSFSYLSEQSGLRGGNLLFHLQRLSDAEMIVQHHERGDYLLTEKGYAVLMGIVEITMALKEMQNRDGSAVPAIESKGQSIPGT